MYSWSCKTFTMISFTFSWPSPWKTLYPLAGTLIFPKCLLSVCTYGSALVISYEWNRTVCDLCHELLSLTVTRRPVHAASARAPFMDGSYPFVSLSTGASSLWHPQSLAIFNNSALNICIQVFFCGHIFHFFCIRTWECNCWSRGNCFTFWRTSQPVFQRGHIASHPHLQCCEGYSFSVSSPTLHLFVCRRPSGCGVVSHVLLTCISLTVNTPLAVTIMEISTQWKRQIMS